MKGSRASEPHRASSAAGSSCQLSIPCPNFHRINILLLCPQGAIGRNFGGERFGPRPIDLDVIFYEDTQLNIGALSRLTSTVLFAAGHCYLQQQRLHVERYERSPWGTMC